MEWSAIVVDRRTKRRWTLILRVVLSMQTGYCGDDGVIGLPRVAIELTAGTATVLVRCAEDNCRAPVLLWKHKVIQILCVVQLMLYGPSGRSGAVGLQFVATDLERESANASLDPVVAIPRALGSHWKLCKT